MGAVHRATTRVVATSFKGVELFPFQQETSVGPDNGSLAGHSIQHVRRQSAGKESLVERACPLLQTLQVSSRVTRYFPGVLKPSAVVVTQLLPLDLFFFVPIVFSQREIPGQHEGDRPGFSGRKPPARRQRGVIGSAIRRGFNGLGILQPSFSGKFIQPLLKRVPPRTAFPGGARGHLGMRGQQSHRAIKETIRVILF